MKKKLIIIILIIIISECILILGILGYLIYFPRESTVDIDTFKEDKLNSTSSYNIKAEVEISGDVVLVKDIITLKKPQKTAFIYLPSMNSAKTDIKQVTADNGVASTTLNGCTLEIQCTDETPSVTINYEITLAKNTEMLSRTDTDYYLTNFLATEAVYRDNKPILTYKSSFGDPYIYEMNNYYVIFKVSQDLKIYAPGNIEEHPFGANKITIFESTNLRDFPAVLSTDAQVEKHKHGGVDVIYINCAETRQYVESILDFAQKNIGPYTYKSLFVVKKALSQKGMEYSNMVFISGNCFKNAYELKKVTYHEVLHQWFYGIIGTDQLEEPFFDEGLVDYLSVMLSGGSLKGTKSSKFLNKQLKDYSSAGEYYELAYYDSAQYFYNIHEKLGNNFYKLLHSIYERKAFQTLYFKEFLQYVDEFSRGK